MSVKVVVKANRGECRICGEDSDLGDGICVKCWDRNADAPKVKRLAEDIKESQKRIGEKVKRHYFKKRELDVLYYISQGYSNLAIANKLKVSIKTVEHHIAIMYRNIVVPEWANIRVWIAINAKKVFEENGQ